MREMKDSGVEWIGEIPENWNTIRLKFFASISSGEMISKDEYDDNGKYPIIGSNGLLGKTNKHNNTEKVITTGRVGTIGTVYITSDAWITDNALKIKTKGILQKYLYYVIPNFDFNLIQSGTAQPLITASKLKNQYIPLPPNLIQEKTVDFLDEKCSQVDTLISNVQSQIEKLKAYKQSLITEIVTKGLDPTVPMKDSGVDWIGEIPAHWDIVRIKQLGTARNGLTYSPSDMCEENEGTLVLRSSNIQDGRLSFDDNVYVNTNIKDELMVRPGDILICSRNGSRKLIGKNAIIDSTKASFGAFMMIFRTTHNSRYIKYILDSSVFSYYLGTFLTATINQLTGANFGSMAIPFTWNTREQESIVAFLQPKCVQIDRLIAIKQQKIEKLNQYKKSLIYEYVTGKREVM